MADKQPYEFTPVSADEIKDTVFLGQIKEIGGGGNVVTATAQDIATQAFTTISESDSASDIVEKIQSGRELKLVEHITGGGDNDFNMYSPVSTSVSTDGNTITSVFSRTEDDAIYTKTMVLNTVTPSVSWTSNVSNSLSILGSISELSDTATETDLVAGSHFVVDTAEGTKRLPSNVVAKQRDIELIEGSIPLDHFKKKLGVCPLSVSSTLHGFINRFNGIFNIETSLPIYAKVFSVNYGDVLNFETTLPNYQTCGQYAFYGENMEVLTPDPIDSVPNAHVTYNKIKAPLGAKYLYVACGSADAVVSCSRDFFAVLDTDNLLYTDKDIVFGPGAVKGGFINRNNGTFTADNEHLVRTFDVAPGLSVNISTTLPGNVACGQYAFYGDNMEVLTTDPIDGTSSVTKVEYNSVQVPDGARYLYVSCASLDYESRVYIRQSSRIPLDEKVFVDFVKSKKTNIASSAGYRGFINRNNGSYTPSDTGDFYVQVFAVPPYSTLLEIKTKNPANPYCGVYAFYGENMEVLTHDPIDSPSTSQNLVYEGVRVPDGAKYLYVACVPIDYAVEVNDVSFVDYKSAKKSAYFVKDVDLTTDKIVVGKTSNIKNNYEMFTHFTFTAFSGVRIWKGNNITYRAAYIDISSSKIMVVQNGSATHDISHGLAITDYLQVLVEVGKMRETKITLFTGNDQKFELDVADFYAHGTLEIIGNSYGYHVESASITYRDLLPNKGIRVYGDSFFQIDDNRWPYYVYKRSGKFALNSLPGSAAAVMYQQVLDDIAIAGYPDIIVWGDGQNENGDTNENAPNGTWLNYVQKLMALLEGKTELVLCTTPSTDTNLHNGICKWVRNSGLRYIDLSAAVAASDTDRNWKSGMKGSGSNANHPTPYGARAMADRVIMDLPEII